MYAILLYKIQDQTSCKSAHHALSLDALHAGHLVRGQGQQCTHVWRACPHTEGSCCSLSIEKCNEIIQSTLHDVTGSMSILRVLLLLTVLGVCCCSTENRTQEQTTPTTTFPGNSYQNFQLKGVEPCVLMNAAVSRRN